MMFGYRKLGYLGAGVAAGAALLAGCTASAPSSSSVPPATTSAASSPAVPTSAAPTSAAASTPATTTPAASPTTTTPGSSGVAGCASMDLRVTAGTAQGAAGSVYQVIVFTNLGATACTLFGYPGVALAAGTPVTQVGAAASRSSTNAPKLVTLAAGGQANVLLRITQAENYPASKCHPLATTYLQIYPPNQTTPLYLPYKSTGCALTSVNLLTIGAVQPGNGG